MTTDAKKAGRSILFGYSALIISQALSMPISLIYFAILIRSLGPEAFGQFTIFMAVAQFFFIIFMSWNRNSIIRFSAEISLLKKDPENVISSQAAVSFIALTLAILIITIFAPRLTLLTGITFSITGILCYYLISYSASDFVLQLMQATHKLRFYASMLLTRQITVLLLLGSFFSFPLFGKINIKKIVYIESISYVLIFLLSIFYLGRNLRIKFNWQKATINYSTVLRIFNYSCPVFIIVTLGYCVLWLDSWMIRSFLGFTAVGEYESANKLIQFASSIIMPLSIISFPLMVAFRHSGYNDLIRTFAAKIVPQICLFWGMALGVIIIFSEPLFVTFFGQKFTHGLLPFQILMTGVSFQILSILHTGVIQSYDQTIQQAINTAFCVLINILLNLLLIPTWGITGVAISKTCTLIACGLLYARTSLHCLGQPGHKFFVYWFLAVPFITLAGQKSTGNIFWGVIIYLILAVYGIILSKKLEVFSKDSYFFWEKITMPKAIRACFKNLFNLLA